MAKSNQCQALGRNGKRCGFASLIGESLCYNHSPTTAAIRQLSTVRGGRRQRVPNATAPVDVSTVEALQTIVGQAIADALVHENSIKRGSLIARLTMVAKALIEVGEIQPQLDQIKDLLARRARAR